MSSSRFITIPDPTPFVDPVTGEVAQFKNEEGVMEDAKPKTHAWFVHTYILSHQVFSLKVGGYDAVRAAKQIAKALDGAEDEGLGYYEVTADQARMMCMTLARPKKDEKDVHKSSAGMTRMMSNFESQCFFEHMDSIMDASTNKPEPSPEPAEPADVPESLLGEQKPRQAEAQA